MVAEPKFTAFQAYLASATKMQAFTCGKCTHWLAPVAGSGQNVGLCKIVSEAGPPGNGEIPKGATCALWNAGPLRIKAQAIVRGRGEGVPGIAPGNLRVRVEDVLVPTQHTVPPPEVERNLVAKQRLG